MMRVLVMPALVAALLAGSAAPPVALAADPILTDQGPNWTQVTREDFYSRDQGSRMIPLAWLQNLKQANGQPFLSDNLARYGYLPNPANTNGLPVGFTASGAGGLQIAGMTCSACHTRQLVANGATYPIDGGAGLGGFPRFLSHLDPAMGQVIASDAAFATSATTVLGPPAPDAVDIATLRAQ